MSDGVITTGCQTLRETCGVCGGYAEDQPLAFLTCFALYALQHRGQESAGIAAGPGGGRKIWLKRGLGLVSEVFPESADLKGIVCKLAVGHVRYPYGNEGSSPENTQPLKLRYRYGELVIAHNGHLLNASALREELECQGAIFQTDTDSELLAHMVARQGSSSLEEALAAVVPRLKGAFAFVISDGHRVIGLRDGFGFRPLSVASLEENGYFLASETCAFDTIGATFIRDVEPGEMVVLDDDGLHSRQIIPESRPNLCIFEYIYFARPDSNLLGRNVHLVRKELGRRLAREHPVQADIVSGVPDSSIAAASGFAEEAGLPYEMALVKNRYIGRTFIKPTQKMREEGVDLKLNAVKKIVDSKKVVLVDDSIVRGTTSLKLIKIMKRAGAKEVHLRISSPPLIGSCYYGIDTPDPHELIAYQRKVTEIPMLIGADSIGYLSLGEVVAAIGLPADNFCRACFTGDYPVRE
ncbi:MAG TPA: amidophosphoribosyltransferase [Firmicutes bacterium]|nr:amidophosphoribosyltransferase [Bacillota bacterium]